MTNMLRIAVTSIALLLADGAIAAPKTVALEIQNVSCETCAPFVKKVLSRVSGVSQVAVVEEGGTATAIVTFDDAKATSDALAQATTNAGYPSRVKEAAASPAAPSTSLSTVAR